MKLTDLDHQQIVRYVYDESQNAQRVTLVGDFDISNTIKDQLKDLKVDAQIDTKEIERIMAEGLKGIQESQPKPQAMEPLKWPEIMEIPHYIPKPEIKVVEIPKYIVQEKIVEVSVPVITKEFEVITVEKQVPIHTTQVEVVRIPENKMLQILVIVNSLAVLGLSILSFVKR